jgi:hypothetical protein
MLANSVDWTKVRQELRARRTEVFDRFMKDPREISLAIEIKLLDDEILDCADHERHEHDAQE